MLYFSRLVASLITAFAVLLFLGTNITCAVIIRNYQISSRNSPLAVVFTRVIINDLLFIIYALLLSVNIYRVSKLPTNFQVLESQVFIRYMLQNILCTRNIFVITDHKFILLHSQGTTKGQAIIVCVFLVPLYVSRAVYNILAISNPTITTFGYSWVDVSDQVRHQSCVIDSLM